MLTTNLVPIATQEFTEIVFDNPPPASQSEDCLFLNIFTPSSPSPIGGRPVMFWIYGGAFEFGYGGLHTYDGSFFAAFEDIIVVTINYRTNGTGIALFQSLPFPPTGYRPC
jgi:carboxylesterase type B